MDSTINGAAVSTKDFPGLLGAKVKVNGAPLTPEQNDLILEFEVETVVNRPDMCTLTFAMQLDAMGQEAKNLPALPAGAQLEVAVDMGGSKPLFAGEITATTYEHFGGRTTLSVTAYDRRHRLYRGEQSRTFTKATYANVVQKLCQEAGLTAKVDGLPNVLHPFLLQRQCSNGDYLDAILAEVGAVSLSDGAGKAKVTTLAKLDESDKQPVDTIEFSVEVTRYSFRSTSDADHDKVTVRGWDPMRKQAFVADPPGAARPAIPAAKGCADYRKPVHSTHNALSADEAKAIAHGISARQRALAVQLEAAGVGNPKLTAGKLIEVKNVVKDFEGKYRLTSVRHNFSPDGFTTEFSCRGFGDHTMPGMLQQAVLGQEAGPRPSQGPKGVFPAIVTNLRDPEKLGRVKVKLPWLSDTVGSDWFWVVSPGAGAGRGFFVLPEVNDTVLVAFEAGDVRRGYVLGGLYNGRDKPPGADHLGSDGKVNKRVIQTRAGHKLVLDDSESAPGIELVTKSGKLKVSLDDKATVFKLESGKDVIVDAKGNITIKSVGNVEVTATGDLKLSGNNVNVEAKMDLVLKGGMNVKVDGGMNTEIKGGMNAKLTGGAGTEVSSGAITTVKGALVKINCP